MYPRMFSFLARNPIKVFLLAEKPICGSLNASFVWSEGMKLNWQVYFIVLLPSFSNFGTAHSTAVAA